MEAPSSPIRRLCQSPFQGQLLGPPRTSTSRPLFRTPPSVTWRPCATNRLAAGIFSVRSNLQLRRTISSSPLCKPISSRLEGGCWIDWWVHRQLPRQRRCSNNCCCRRCRARPKHGDRQRLWLVEDLFQAEWTCSTSLVVVANTSVTHVRFLFDTKRTVTQQSTTGSNRVNIFRNCSKNATWCRLLSCLRFCSGSCRVDR